MNGIHPGESFQNSEVQKFQSFQDSESRIQISEMLISEPCAFT
jgi:hypothetical protein